MSLFVETIIYLFVVMGIIAIIGGTFDIFKNNDLIDFSRITRKIFVFNKNEVSKGKSVKIDIYLENLPDKEEEEVLERIKNSEELKEIADYINVYKTFDNE